MGIFFYLVCISCKNPISTTLTVEPDSVTYYNGTQYVREKIIHDDYGVLTTRNSYIWIHNNSKITIGEVRNNRVKRKYKITKEKQLD